jgi:hypothetical protein
MADEWHPLGEVLYRKWTVYDMAFPEFGNSLFSARKSALFYLEKCTDFYALFAAKDIDNFVICGAQVGLTPPRRPYFGFILTLISGVFRVYFGF